MGKLPAHQGKWVKRMVGHVPIFWKQACNVTDMDDPLEIKSLTGSAKLVTLQK